MTTINAIRITSTERELVPVSVECVITDGIGIHVIGLVDTQVKEALLRAVTALQSSGYHLPGRKIVINLAPANLCCKTGNGYDLPIAIAILLESKQARFNPEGFVFHAELGIDGSLRRTGDEDEIIGKSEGHPYDVVFAYESDADDDMPGFSFSSLRELISYAETFWAN